MSMDPGSRVLWAVAFLHGLAALGWLVAAAFEGPSVTGVHFAFKPLKFAISIAVFLATLAVFLPRLGLPRGASLAIGGLLALTMLIEMGCISVQALRGTTSHFNTSSPFDAALWQLMVGAIVVATAVMIGLALLASTRPLIAPDGEPLSAVMSIAWRLGVWMFLLVAITGFGMGGRLQHSVQGTDGGEGLAFLNWSVRHGDLRVAHFLALHALQVLPLGAFFIEHVVDKNTLAWFGALAVAFVLACVGAYVQALRGRPLLTLRSELVAHRLESANLGAEEGNSAHGEHRCAPEEERFKADEPPVKRGRHQRPVQGERTRGRDEHEAGDSKGEGAAPPPDLALSQSN
ncbi:MAG: hypothetical protein AAGE52_34085 [Myxococcota bacterium]